MVVVAYLTPGPNSVPRFEKDSKHDEYPATLNMNDKPIEERLLDALRNLVDALETDGTLHSERCDCDFCQAYKVAERLVNRKESP